MQLVCLSSILGGIGSEGRLVDASRAIATIIAIVAITGFTFPNTASAEIMYYDGFLQHATGNLDGKSNSYGTWEVTDTPVEVQDSVYYQPPNGIYSNGQSGIATTSFSTALSSTTFSGTAIYSFDYYTTDADLTGASFRVSGIYNENYTGTYGQTNLNEICAIYRTDPGTDEFLLVDGDGDSTTTNVDVSIDTWYNFQIELNPSAATCRARVNLGNWVSLTITNTINNYDQYAKGIFVAFSPNDDIAYIDEVLLTSGTIASTATTPYVDYIYPTNESNITDGNIVALATIYDPADHLPNYAYIQVIQNVFAGSAQTIYSSTTPLTGNSPWYIEVPLELTSDYVYNFSVTPYKDNYSNNWTNGGATFSVGSTTYYSAFQTLYGNGLYATTTAICNPPTSILDVGGGFTYALCSMFIPPANVLNQFANIPTIVASKFPFNYIAGLRDIYTNIASSSASSTPNVTFDLPNMQDIEFINPAHALASSTVVATSRTYLGYFIYFMFGILAFRGVTKLV